MKLKKLVSLLCAVLLLLPLAACANNTSSRNDGENQAGTNDQNPANIIANGEMSLSETGGVLSYAAERISLPAGLDYLTAFAYDDNNGTLYVCGKGVSDGQNNGQELTSIYAVSLDGEPSVKLDYSEPAAGTIIRAMGIDQNAMLWAFESGSEYVYNAAGDIVGHDVNYQLIAFDTAGTQKAAIPINKEWNPMDMRVCGEHIFIISPDKMHVLDTSGSKLFEIAPAQNQSITVTGRGIAEGFPTADGYSVSLLNLAERRFDKIVSFDTSFRGISGGENTIYADDGTSLYSYDLDTASGTLLLSWMGVGLLGNYQQLYELPDDGILYCAFDGVYVLRARERDFGLGGEATLTLATMNANTVKRTVLEFNASNNGYTIEIEDYSIYNTNPESTEGLTKLITDITTGKVPDIIDLSDIPGDMYLYNALLEDLMPYFASDNDINLSDFDATALIAMTTDGKLLNLIPMFSILSVVGRSSDIDGKSIDSFSDLAAIAQGNSVFGNTLSRSELIMYALGASNSKFVDTDTGACYFNTSEFIEFLEFVKTLPEAEDWRYNDVEIASGRQRFLCAQIGTVGGYTTHTRLYFGESISLTGMPSSKNNGAILIPGFSYGMSSVSQHKEGVWEFFKLMLSDAYIENYTSGYYTIKNSINDYSVQLYRDWIASGGSLTYYIGNQAVETNITDETDIDLHYELLASVTGTFRHNEALYNMVMEDAAAFFAGTKTAAQAADIIQSRASIYLSERR